MYITAFRLLECKAIFSRGASTRQRPFSENVHLPKVGTVKSVSKSVLQHYSAVAPFSKDRQLNRFGQLLPRNDATRRPAPPISYKLITSNQTRLRKVVSRTAALRWCKATVLYCRGSAVQSEPLVLSFRSLSYLLRNFVLSFHATRDEVSCSAAETLARMPQRMARNERTVLDSRKRIELDGRKTCRSIIYVRKRVKKIGKNVHVCEKIYRLFGIIRLILWVPFGKIGQNIPPTPSSNASSMNRQCVISSILYCTV